MLRLNMDDEYFDDVKVCENVRCKVQIITKN